MILRAGLFFLLLPAITFAEEVRVKNFAAGSPVIVDATNFSKDAGKPLQTDLNKFEAKNDKPKLYAKDVNLERELKMGYYVDALILDSAPVVDDPKLQAVVDEIGARLVKASSRPELKFTFKVLNTSEPNAFSGPGGFVYITSGLLGLLETKDEVAGVLGHEIAHICQRDTMRRMDTANGSQALAGAMVVGTIVLAANSDSPAAVAGVGLSAAALTSVVMYQGYSREQEIKADELSMDYISVAGFDPSAAIKMMDRMLEYEKKKKLDRPPRLLSSHPYTEARKQHLEKRITLSQQTEKEKS